MQTRDEVEGLHKCRGSLDVSNAQIMGYNFKNNKKKNIKPSSTSTIFSAEA